MSQLQRFPSQNLHSYMLRLATILSIAGLFYYQLLIMDKNRGQRENCRGNHFSRAETLSRLMTILSLLVGLEEGETKGRETECVCSGNDFRHSKSTYSPNGFYFPVALRSAIFHHSVPCSNARHVSLPFALGCKSQHSNPVWIRSDMAFDFALHLCTSWVIKRQERGQRNVRCCSQPQTHIVQLGCCHSPMCHLHF